MALNQRPDEFLTTSGKPKKTHVNIKTQIDFYKQEMESDLKKKDMSYKYGWLSKVFGTNERTVPLYIVAVTSGLLLLFSGVYTFFFTCYPQSAFTPKELWSITVPVLTSMLGYIFGKSSSDNKESNE